MSELSRRSLIKGAGALGAAIATGTASTALARHRVDHVIVTAGTGVPTSGVLLGCG